ncbi:MAG: hypothetical protein MUF51_07970, partial [Vicinamibacteria bacterium]|nr:hypothetical protein [Vicinamibacteria bacterium]
RWFRLGKIAQDSLLKFGLLPLFLAVMGYRRASGPLRDLLSAWFVSGGLLGLLAVLTPFSLRFEYFLVPAVAMAAGLGAAQLIETRRVRWVQVIWLIVFALQFISACLMLTHHYQMIAVIMDSPRGTAPFHF